MAATAALASAGYDVDLFESRPYLGGRATSYTVPIRRRRGRDHRQLPAHPAAVLRQSTRFLLAARCARSDRFPPRVLFHRAWRTHIDFPRRRLPEAASFPGSFLGMRYLSAGEKIALVRGLLRLQTEYGSNAAISTTYRWVDWLQEKRQPQRVVERFWRQILVSAINEELDRMAAAWGFQVFWLGFLASQDCYEMGVPISAHLAVYIMLPILVVEFPNGACASANCRSRELLRPGDCRRAELLGGLLYQCCPFRAGRGYCPEHGDGFEHSPITGIHIWFDRPVTDLPHATLLDRTFNGCSIRTAASICNWWSAHPDLW